MTDKHEAMNKQDSPDKERHNPRGDQQDKFRFGNYDLVRRIDKGGMGEVYLARQRTAFGREVAIKIIRSDLVHDITSRQRFLREAEVNAHIKHEHILPLFEFGEEQGRLFMVTPYIAGGTLARRLQAGPLSLDEVHQLFTALLQAVIYIHHRGVVHRDLKPSNILLDSEGNNGRVYVRLIDFGIASIAGQAASPPLTTADTEMGTLAYMAPERFSGIAAPSNDIYSLGVILYQMLTGQLPTDERRIALPQPLEYVVDHCLAPIDQSRFKSAEDLLNAFEYAYDYLTADQQEQDGAAVPPPVPVASSRIVPTSTPRPNGHVRREIRTLHRSDNLPDMPDLPMIRPSQPDAFAREDYESPTMNIDVSQHNSQSRVPTAPSSLLGTSAHARKRRRNPLLALITILTAIILLVIAGLSLFTFQSITIVSANVNFSPQVHAINKVFPIKGSVSQSTVDVNSATIPVKTGSLSKSGSQTGETSQQCFFTLCRHFVTSDDVNRIEGQLKQSLDTQISTQIQQKLQAQGAVQVSSAEFITTSVTSDPPIGTESKTVTVTMTEQGQFAYFLKQDAQSLARLLLNREVQKLGANYILLSTLTQIGQPVVISSDNSGNVFINIAAGGDAQYQFSSAELHAIPIALKSMKVKDAISSLKQRSGVDPTTVSIHLSSGDTMPGDIQQIKIFTINPTNLPPVQLPPVSASTTPTTSNNNNPTSTPTADNG
jgi:serine/threonine protein kinase